MVTVTRNSIVPGGLRKIYNIRLFGRRASVYFALLCWSRVCRYSCLEQWADGIDNSPVGGSPARLGSKKS